MGKTNFSEWCMGAFIGGLTVVAGVLSLTAGVPYADAAKMAAVQEIKRDLAGPQANQPLAPLVEHRAVTKEILSRLSSRHLNKMRIDDNWSQKVLNRYLDDLDSDRTIFVAADIERFNAYQFDLDDLLEKGQVQVAFEIFRTYQLRAAQRLQYLIDQVSVGVANLKFKTPEWIENRKETSAWYLDADSQKKHWQKTFKNDVLNLVLADREPDQIKDLLLKRYKNRLVRLYQTQSEDVYRLFLNAVAQIYDPHTTYYSPRASENFNIRMRLSLEGIGAVLQTDDQYTKVVRLVPAGPADKSGQLHPGDRIVGVGQGRKGEILDVVGWRIDDVVDLIRGPKQTVVRLEVMPSSVKEGHATKVVNITRNTVKLEDQAARKRMLEFEYEGRHHRFGVIDLPAFYIDYDAYYDGDENYRSSTGDVRRLLEELVATRVDGIIIDLRDNGGGALKEAQSLAGLFVETGPLVQIRNTKGRTMTLRDKDPEIVYQGPLAVLVNRMSASASEIFAGVIQDYGRGIVLGSQTFGKGTVQSLISLKRGQLKVTTAKFYRITGEGTQRQGIIPDIDFPPIYDSERIGESALDGALAWDVIRAKEYDRYADTSGPIRTVRQKFEKRLQTNAQFKALSEGMQYLSEIRKQEKVSLQIDQRRKDQKVLGSHRLALENSRRQAKGLKPLATVEDLEDAEETADDSIDKEETISDPFVVESGRILADYIGASAGPPASNLAVNQ